MNNQDPHVIIDRYPDAERANRNKNISIVAFASDRLDNSFNITEDISSRIFSIPMHPYLSDDEINEICTALIKVKNEL